MNAKLHGRLFTLLSTVIFLGVALMIQPFAFDLFTYGFPLLLVGIVGFIVLDHVPTRAAGEESDDV
ncbi:MAG: hypothetical protein RIC87_10800 [Kiloniellales bacterium]